MGNGLCENAAWYLLPDPLILAILRYLKAQELLQVAGVCVSWSRVARDEQLWKWHLIRDFKLDRRTCLSSLCFNSWFEEYRRLFWLSPTQLVQIMKDHTDEVLHVAFSRSGNMFATTSKDCSVKLWSSEHPCELLCAEDLFERFHWRYTQFSQFNDHSTLLLVSGVHFGPQSTSGEVVVFEIDADDHSMTFRCRVRNKPYDIFGCWYDASHVLNGELHWMGTNLASLSEIWLCKASQELQSERLSVLAPLFKFLNRNGSTIRMLLVTRYLSPQVKFALEYNQLTASGQLPEGSDFGQRIELFLSAHTASSEIHTSSVGTTSEGSGKCRGCCVDPHSITPMNSEEDEYCDRLMIFSTGTFTYTPHQIGFKLIRGKEAQKRLNAELMSAERRREVEDRMREYRNRTTQEQQKVASDSVPSPQLSVPIPPEPSQPVQAEDPADMVDEEDSDDESDAGPAPVIDWDELAANYDKPDHVIETNGHIIGMVLSNDQRFLFVNLRTWPANCVVGDPYEPPPIAQQIEIRVVDLETLSLLPQIYYGHNAYTPNDECFFIFLDACQQFVASGSEDTSAYVWDRHHRCLISRLEHVNVVNSVAFNPGDSEMLVSVSDDKLIKVWRSRRARRAIEKGANV